MELFRFGEETGNHFTHYDSNFIMSRLLITQKPTRIGCMHLEANGLIGFHQASVPQLLLIVDGQGWVRSDDLEKVHVQKGDAAFWVIGEGHETGTDTGLTAIVIEAEELSPSLFIDLQRI